MQKVVLEFMRHDRTAEYRGFHYRYLELKRTNPKYVECVGPQYILFSRAINLGNLRHELMPRKVDDIIIVIIK